MVVGRLCFWKITLCSFVMQLLLHFQIRCLDSNPPLSAGELTELCAVLLTLIAWQMSTPHTFISHVSKVVSKQRSRSTLYNIYLTVKILRISKTNEKTKCWLHYFPISQIHCLRRTWDMVNKLFRELPPCHCQGRGPGVAFHQVAI